MKNNFPKLLTGLLVLLWISGCTTSPNTAVSISTSTETILPPTELPTQTEAINPPIRTSIPTLTENEARAEIQRLLSDESSCSFPCWWGFTPGQTQIAELRNLLESFSIFSVGPPIFQPEEGYIRLIVPQTETSYLQLIFVYKGSEDVLEMLWLSVQMMHKVIDADGRSHYEVSWGDPLLAEITKPYNLSNVLSKYGKPSEVLIRTYQATLLNRPWPISLVISYPEQGFMIEYVANGRGAPNESISWCPALAFSNYWFWSPSSEKTMLDVVSQIPGEQLNHESLIAEKFKTIEEAADMSIEEFYSLFKDNEDRCIETPINMWPMPGQ